MPRTTDKCKSCNGSLMSTHGNANFCSHDCRKTDRRKKHAEWRAQNPGPGRGRRSTGKWTTEYKSRYMQLYRIERTYGVDPETAEILALRVTGQCDICKRTPESGRKHHIDHCHTTGKIRGVLCHHCNTAIGLLREDQHIIHKAAEYLQQHTL